MTPFSAAHITHEACEKIGGIGTVLEGIITSPVYQQHVRRTILVGPLFNHMEVSPEKRVGEDGHVLYSTVDGIDEVGLGGKLKPIEWAFNVAFVYGKRHMTLPGSDDHTGEAEVLLIDVFNINTQHVNNFKKRLFEVFGINSLRYEGDWGYEEYVRLAEPAFYALLALLVEDDLPCVLFGHEFMGLPTAFKAIMDGQKQFRTVFHAHECATARQLVENHPGHDVRFYNILKQAREQNLYVSDVFGDRNESFRHALISQSHVCDAIIAVGPHTAKEMHFLGRHFDHHHIDLVFNGVPPLTVTEKNHIESRAMLSEYAQRLVEFKPDVLMTHVTRPVISKGIWRDLQVCHELDWRFEHEGRKGVLFILTSAGGTRRSRNVLDMEQEYGWPRRHREGYPDLVGPEIEINRSVEEFNAAHSHIQAVLVNQFGWSRERLGSRLPEGMTFADFRRGTDVEFGPATYEPFGISPLEPLGSGAICVISSVCGCKGFVDEVTGGKGADNVLVADYLGLEHPRSIPDLLGMSQFEREQIEKRVASEIAEQLMQRLPRNNAQRAVLVARGQELVHQMGWDAVLERKLIPMLERILNDKA